MFKSDRVVSKPVFVTIAVVAVWIQASLLLIGGGYLYVDSSDHGDGFGTVVGAVTVVEAIALAGLVVGVMKRRDGARVSLVAVEVLILAVGLAGLLIGEASLYACIGPMISLGVIMCLVESVTRKWFQQR